MKPMKKRYIAIIVALLLLLAVLVSAVCFYYVRHVEESELYKMVAPYRNGETDWKTPGQLSFDAESGEALFLQGMDAFAAEEYAAAKMDFEKALAAGGSDPALSAWLYYYINECIRELTGTGDCDTVALGLDAAADYGPMANDSNMLWSMVESITGTPETDAEAIALMEEYLENTKDLEPATWARIKNCIAMLQYVDGEYAKAIRNFYDVELELEDAELTSGERSELRFAQEYIANIHYVFEDYERAAVLYQELAESAEPGSGTEIYSFYVNMITAYLEMEDLEQAEEAMAMLEDVIPQMEESARPEVEAVKDNVMADLLIAGGDYTEAEAYIEKAQDFYDNNEESLFYGGAYHVVVTRCELMLHTGEEAAAQSTLEELMDSGKAAYYGLEEDIQELLIDLYQKTGQDENLTEAYAYILEHDEQFTATIQREYLDFSEYYRDAIRLEHRNTELSRTNTISILIIMVFAVILVAAFFLTRLLRMKNVTDQLTGVYNRKKLNQLMQKYDRAGTPGQLGVVMSDIDFFKRYNDTYGHPAGDEVLKQVASVLSESVRRDDLVIRYGGEEFLVLLNGLPGQTAYDVCQRIRDRLAECTIPHEASEASDHVTLSLGLCYQESAGTKTMDELIKFADECLYMSKESGRDRVTEKRI